MGGQTVSWHPIRSLEHSDVGQTSQETKKQEGYDDEKLSRRTAKVVALSRQRVGCRATSRWYFAVPWRLRPDQLSSPGGALELSGCWRRSKRDDIGLESGAQPISSGEEAEAETRDRRLFR